MLIKSRLAWFAVFILLIVLLVGGVHRQRAVALEYSAPRAAPEFTHTEPEAWINSAPRKLADFKGKVVLIDFWTFDCWNCYRSFPWLHELEEQFSDQPFQESLILHQISCKSHCNSYDRICCVRRTVLVLKRSLQKTLFYPEPSPLFVCSQSPKYHSQPSPRSKHFCFHVDKCLTQGQG